jgi:NTE family protein
MPNALPEPKPVCILVLQGGGAMAAYHIGAFEALREHPFEPDWVCGISMGAINGAIIAGNAPERRVEKLEAFWHTISRPSILPHSRRTAVRTWEHAVSFAEALTLGQPGFFSPRPISPYFAQPGVAATSFYDTTPLYGTLAEVVDFGLLNRAKTRLSVGATNVETGELAFFDTHRMPGTFAARHVIASGSLPPGFPATMIDGKPYWDGGCISNSPLQAVVDDMPSGHSVVFVIDLWSAAGKAPDTMQAVAWRAKQIQYASVTPTHVSAMVAKVKLRKAQQMLQQPGAAPSADRLDIVHITYHPGEDQIPSSDAEFSRESIATRRAAGYEDMHRVLIQRPWHRSEPPAHFGCLVHHVTADGVHTRAM